MLGLSVKEAIREALQFCEIYGVTRTGELEIVVTRIVQQVRKRTKHEENFYCKEFHAFEPLSMGSHWNVAEPKREIAWTSRINLDET